MLAFQKKPQALGARLLSNPSVHVSILAVLVAFGSFYIFKQQQQLEMARRVDYLQSGPKFANVSAAKTGAKAVGGSEMESQNSVASSAVELAESSNIAEVDASEPKGFVEGASSTPIANSNEIASVSPATATKVEIRYALLPRALVNRMVQEARSQAALLDWGDYKVGSTRSFAEIIQSADVLEKVEKTFSPDASDLNWFVGKKTQDIELGLHIKMSIASKSATNLTGEIEVLRSFFEGVDESAVPLQKGFSAVPFDLPPKTALFLLVPLPRVTQEPGAASGISLLRAFRMTDFMTQKQSEFVILINPIF